MRVLGLSGAAKIVSLGLLDEDRVLVETTVADLHAEKLMFYVKEAGIEPEQVAAVAVAAGPGSYAGLRGSLSAAKSIAQALKLPLTGVSTLEAIAYNLIEIVGTVLVLLDARADEYNAALFGCSDGKLRRLTDDMVMKQDGITSLLAKVSGDIYLAGSTSGFKDKLTGANYRFAAEAHSQPYGINVARLGLLKIKEGRADDPLELTPLYSHQPNIREFGSR